MLLPSHLPPSRVPDPADAPPLGWGISATGGIARSMASTLRANTTQRLVAVASRSADRAAAFAHEYGVERSYGDYAALLADPDVQVVYVASPHSEHHRQALAAIQAGKHVLVEKVFTRSADQARELAAAAESAGVLLMEAMWARFLPQTDVLRQLLADGALGDIQTVIVDHGQYFDVAPEHRLVNPALAGGALLDLGVYPVSFASFVYGSPQSVLATGRLTERGVDSQVSAILTAASGAHAVLTTTLLALTPTTAAVAGTIARAELTGFFYAPGTLTVTARDGQRLVREPAGLTGNDALAYEAAELARLVSDGRRESPLLPVAESISIMQTLDEIRRQVGIVYPGE